VKKIIIIVITVCGGGHLIYRAIKVLYTMTLRESGQNCEEMNPIISTLLTDNYACIIFIGDCWVNYEKKFHVHLL